MNWMKHYWIFFLLSSLIIVPGVYSLIRFGLKPSIEFTGGTRLTVENVKTSSDIVVQSFNEFTPSFEDKTSNSVTLKTKNISQETAQKAIDTIKKENPEIKITSFESIGASLGKETIRKTLWALAISSVLLLMYISFTFKQFKYGVCAVIAMLHDSLILIGSFSLLGHFFGVEVDLLFVTAVLTILSFSTHDTIVNYDRIRELSHKNKGTNFVTIINQAITENMVRSLNNSLTIIFMLIALFLIGGETTKYFSLALLIGTITGTYSSTFTAAPLLVVWEKLFNKKK